MKVLGIETSCDETAAAVVSDGREVLSNVVNSQVEFHKKFSGVVPEIACRKHIETITCVVDEALKKAHCDFYSIDRIAVTNRPGLIGALLIGLSFAKSIAYARGIPLVPVSHIEAHAYSACLTHMSLSGPYISLVVSGGHTSLYLVKDFKSFDLLGKTIDDAVGEAYDKVAKVLGMSYPGGPEIDRLVRSYKGKAVSFPRTYLEKDSLDFSFSGIKTAVLYKVHPPANKTSWEKEKVLNEQDILSVAKGFQESIVDVLVRKSIAACQRHDCRKLAIGGGVARNSRLRERLLEECSKRNIETFYPDRAYCTDNAAMIAGLGYYQPPIGTEAMMTLDATPTI